MNTYELTLVLDGKFTPAKRKATLEKLKTQIEVFSGKIVDTIEWGDRDLAYPIKKVVKGHFLTMPLEMEGAEVRKLNDKLRLDESILRYLLIKTKAHRQAVKKAKVAKKEDVETKEE